MMDEQNSDSLQDSQDILPALNRGQDYAWDIYSRHYPDPIVQHETLALSNGTAEYGIPENIFEERLLKVEIDNGRDSYYEVPRVAFNRLSQWESPSSLTVPHVYAIVGRKLRFAPAPTGTYNARIWTLRDVEQLVPVWGRVTKVGAGSGYLILSDNGNSELTTATDQLDSYFNVIDGQTGEIRGTFQAKTYVNGKVTIKTIPHRDTVIGRTVSTDLTDVASPDDYICDISGTCVPYFAKPTTNFLVEYAIAELRRKLGGSADMELHVLQSFEKQVEHTWVGREQSLRVKRRNGIWQGGPLRTSHRHWR